MRRQLCMAGIIVVCFMLMGCGHEHTWVEATCTEPKTCSECSKTEGEALGHTWVEATCAEAKHCSVCGETVGETLEHTWVEATCAKAKHCNVCGEIEGEPLEHTLIEANYQQPATCEICGETVGEPLQADFEKYGLVCNAELNTKYPISIPWDRDGITKVTAGEVVFSDYEIFDSDDTHEAAEGYEWRVITITELCDINAVYAFNDMNFFPIPIITDYYCDLYNTYNENTDTYTLNYNGVDYTDVKLDGEMLQNDWNDDIKTFQARYICRVPKGYDGLVVTVDNVTDSVSNEQLNGGNVFLRLK